MSTTAIPTGSTAWRDHFGVDDPHVLVWQAETRLMNPTVSGALIQRELERDPDSASSEWLAKFREDLESAFTTESLDACVIPGRDELPPSTLSYRWFVDPSGGRRDSFTLAIGHREKNIIVLDLVREWRPPFDPSEIVKEAATVAKAYRCLNISGDNYSGEWSAEAFRPSQRANPDDEVLSAIRPAMATIPDAKLLCISIDSSQMA